LTRGRFRSGHRSGPRVLSVHKNLIISLTSCIL
jgi:hypothetical protein